MNRAFLQHFLRDPQRVGALVPLSQSVAKELIVHLNERTEPRPWKILEVGAGTGNVTQMIIESLGKADQLDVIEIDMECCDLLKNKFAGLPNVSVKCLSILDWNPDYKYDFIVSTLPLNSFSPDFIAKIWNHYQNISNEQALCTYVEYIGLEKLNLIFSKREKRSIIKARSSLLRKFLKTHLIEKHKVLTNFLPCYVYHIRLHVPAGRLPTGSA